MQNPNADLVAEVRFAADGLVKAVREMVIEVRQLRILAVEMVKEMEKREENER